MTLKRTKLDVPDSPLACQIGHQNKKGIPWKNLGIPVGSNHLEDVHCGGAMGILDPLSRRVGASGRVIGVDNDQRQLAAARAYVQELGRTNIELVEQDAYQTDFPRGAFDFRDSKSQQGEIRADQNADRISA